MFFQFVKTHDYLVQLVQGFLSGDFRPVGVQIKKGLVVGYAVTHILDEGFPALYLSNIYLLTVVKFFLQVVEVHTQLLNKQIKALNFVDQTAASVYVIKHFGETGLTVKVGQVGTGTNGYALDRKSTRLNSSHVRISYAV